MALTTARLEQPLRVLSPRRSELDRARPWMSVEFKSWVPGVAWAAANDTGGERLAILF